jgi:hypothetical protein
MTRDHLRRATGLRRGALVLLAAFAVALAATAPAMAGQPKGNFVDFNHCPLKNPELTFCVYAESTGGEFSIKTTKVPIIKASTVVLQGGSILNEETGAETFVEAEGAETLKKTPLAVPGGLLGIIAPEALPKFLQVIINKLVSEGLAGVTATAELVGTPGISRANLIESSGTAVSLPTRIHLENTFLGKECYIGSKTSPVTFNLTTGTTSPPEPNKPITGTLGQLEFGNEFQYVIARGNRLVDNAFSVPGANGCGGVLLSLLIDPAIELKLGLPSAAGNNTAILEGELQNGGAGAVRESEK